MNELIQSIFENFTVDDLVAAFLSTGGKWDADEYTPDYESCECEEES